MTQRERRGQMLDPHAEPMRPILAPPDPPPPTRAPRGAVDDLFERRICVPAPSARPVADALSADLLRLAQSGALFSATLAATALTLARALDEGPSNTTAGVAKELRATLDKLAEGAQDDRSDDFSGLSAPAHGGSGPDVSAPVGDTAPF